MKEADAENVEALEQEKLAAAPEQGQRAGDEADETQKQSAAAGMKEKSTQPEKKEKLEKRKQVTETDETLLAMQTGDTVMAEGEDTTRRSKKRTEETGQGQPTSESGREQHDGAATTQK